MTVTDSGEATGGSDPCVVHLDDSDVAALWRSYRDGSVPLVAAAVDRTPPAMQAWPTAGEVALGALHHELGGHHARACTTLASVRDPLLVAGVVDVLVETGAAALERLRERSRYPVPTDLLVTHLPTHAGIEDGAAFSRWWNMVEVVAFRAAGLRLTAPHPRPDAPPFDVAFSAFHATSTIVRFTARRQWRRPDALLVDLAAVR